MRSDSTLKYGRRLPVSLLLAGLAAACLPFMETPVWFNWVVAIGMIVSFNAIAMRLRWPAEQRTCTTLLHSVIALVVSLLVYVGLKACEHYLTHL